MHGQIQGLLVFTPLGELAVIFTWVSCLTDSSKDDQKRIKCVYLAILFQI